MREAGRLQLRMVARYGEVNRSIIALRVGTAFGLCPPYATSDMYT